MRSRSCAAATAMAAALLVACSTTPHLAGELRGEVRRILEAATPAEHHDHGHDFGDEPQRVICAVEVFGYDPANAATVAQVTWVYAHHLCAIGAGGEWKLSIRASGPLAVHLDGSPEVRVPRSGAAYQDEVRRIIPSRHHDEAFGTFTDPDVIEEARLRFESS